MCAAVNIDSVARTRPTYHHGDLRNALVRAGAELAERGGPESVTIRAAAKKVGVTPTAAYRHFAGHEELFQAVKEHAFDTLAKAMAHYLDSLEPVDDPVLDAVRRLNAAGRGYIRFARTEPGLFRTAFFRGATLPDGEEAERPDNPFGMLGAVLDRLADVGYLAPHSRPMAELAAWSAAHGVAMMIIDGPLREMPKAEQDQVVDRVLTVLTHGLGDGPAAAPMRARDGSVELEPR